MMNIRYVNSAGESVNLNKKPYKMLLSSIFDSEWDTVSDDNDHILGFTKGIQKKEVIIDCLGDSEKTGRQYQNELAAIFTKDVVAGNPGKLYCNDEYMICYLPNVSKDMWYTGRIVSCTYGLVTDYPYWIKEDKFSLAASGDDTSGKKYNYKYPYTYGISGKNNYIAIDHYDESDFLMHVHGPVTEVNVIIGSNRYKVNTTLSETDALIIDSRPTAQAGSQVYKLNNYGEITNMFDLRDPDRSIFSKIPYGEVPIDTNGATVELTVFEKRSEPQWI